MCGGAGWWLSESIYKYVIFTSVRVSVGRCVVCEYVFFCVRIEIGACKSIPIAILTVLTFRTLDAIVPADGAVGLCISLTDSNPSLRIDIFSLLLSSLPFSWPTNDS